MDFSKSVLSVRGPRSLGIAYTTDIASGKFTQTNWTGVAPARAGHPTAHTAVRT